MILFFSQNLPISRRLPQGRRGLKYCEVYNNGSNTLSPPAREAWIEISVYVGNKAQKWQSPPAREAWIEIDREHRAHSDTKQSPPAREAWIEIVAISQH